MLSLSPTRSPAASGALQNEVVALMRSHGDADPGVVIRLACQRVAAHATILEAKAIADEADALKNQLEILRLALRLERLRRELKANFDPGQPRDEFGRWTDGGEITENDLNAIILLASDISGFTKHGINQAITRGVSPVDLLDALNNPLQIYPQSDGRIRYEGQGAVVVLNNDGRVITVWRKK